MSLCYGANWHPPNPLHQQNTMSNTSHGPWRYWCYYTWLFWDLHKQIRRIPQIFRQPKSLCGNSKNMRTSRTRRFYYTNSIDHKEMTICTEDQNRMDLVDMLCSYCTNPILPDLLHKKMLQQFFFECTGVIWGDIRCCLIKAQIMHKLKKMV